jgi:hypothetical protein
VDTGSLVLESFLTPAAYQQAWNDNNAAGRQLAYLVAYNHSDGPRFSAIFQQKVAGTGGTVGHHGLTAAQMQTNYDQNLAVGLLTRVIAGYDQNGQALTPPPGVRLPRAPSPPPAVSANSAPCESRRCMV